jgi:hypothetical protein
MAQAATQTTTSTKSRKTLRKEGRDKRFAKLQSDVEFRKKYFEGKSKRAADKKSAFLKKKKRKK